MNMQYRDPDAALRQAKLARQQLLGTASMLKTRISPSSLREEASEMAQSKVDDLVNQAMNWARKNPAVFAAFGAAIGLYLVHRFRPRNRSETGQGQASLTE